MEKPLLLLMLVALAVPASAAENDDCVECHRRVRDLSEIRTMAAELRRDARKD